MHFNCETCGWEIRLKLQQPSLIATSSTNHYQYCISVEETSQMARISTQNGNHLNSTNNKPRRLLSFGVWSISPRHFPSLYVQSPTKSHINRIDCFLSLSLSRIKCHLRLYTAIFLDVLSECYLLYWFLLMYIDL